MTREKSCGAVIFFPVGKERLYLIEQMRKGHFSMCKGHVEAGESERETAAREIREETALRVRFLDGFRETEEYSPYEGCMKEVVFFLAQAESTRVSPQPEEVRDILWLPRELALKQLSFESDREILRRADVFLSAAGNGEAQRAEKGLAIEPYTADRIDDVVHFEEDLRREEDVWGWDIDDAYLESVRKSFRDDSFRDSISLLAYSDGKVVGRIDSSMIKSRFDGSTKAYLDWICVLKSQRHRGVAQALLRELKARLRERGVATLVALTAANDEAQRFYRAIPDSEMHDVGIWIDVK